MHMLRHDTGGGPARAFGSENLSIRVPEIRVPEIRVPEIRVPGSIANLGPGFDTIAVAISLYIELRVTMLPGAGALEFVFPAGAVEGENRIERAFRYMAERKQVTLPSIRVEVSSEIPVRSGLGSSAAATIAGLRLFEAVAAPLTSSSTRGELLTAASILEGHPDNSSACLLGGVAISMQKQDGTIAAESFCWPQQVHLLVLTPQIDLATLRSRAVLPLEIPFEHATRNLQRLAFLLWALRGGDIEYLREALRDEIHQPYRASMVPGLDDLVALRHPDLLGVCLSGAGPSLLALSRGRSTAVQELIAKAYQATCIPFALRWLAAHQPEESPVCVE
jgi:homoserine kinase